MTARASRSIRFGTALGASLAVFAFGAFGAFGVLGACGPAPRGNSSDGGSRGSDGGAGGDGGNGGDGAPVNQCKVQGSDNDAPPQCTMQAPPNSFDPVIEWTWTGSAEPYSIVTPLVANLTDDNGDGSIDLCDIPDVVVVASTESGSPDEVGHIYLLNGSNGSQELMIPTAIDGTVTPALGDINHDGIPDIVTVDTNGALWAFNHDGSVIFGPGDVWGGPDPGQDTPQWYSGALALADLDHDGNVEIIGGNQVWDSTGHVKWIGSEPQAPWSSTTVADLDGDGFLEVVTGATAYHYDGTVYWTTSLAAGYPQVADFNGDGLPEVLLTNINGLSLITHDGTILYQSLRPTGTDNSITENWTRPATVGDFRGDGSIEYAMSSASFYTEYNANGSSVWSATVSDESGIAGGTAFDFLGDGKTEAMYADEHNMYVFDATGAPIFSIPRSSGTLSEYPVVADINNDGSSEIIVVSNQYFGDPASPTVQVIRDSQDRWIESRRIWNEHTYHVTNVREDGTIPQFEQPAWKSLNTFRTNAQINGNGVCNPIIDLARHE